MLFSELSFGINEGDKIGIVAKNGTGKTSLLEILSGRSEADSGTITFRAGTKVGYLPQHPVLPADSSIESIFPPSEALDAAKLLGQLGIHDLSRTAANLSGGEAKRIALVKAILDQPDLLILDEPTNHLDIPTVEWLESILSRQRGSLLMVTHDRYFLDRFCNQVLELDMAEGYLYEGNYGEFLRRRAERLDGMEARMAKIKNTLRKELEWMSRQPQARAGKAKFRIDRFHDLSAQASVRRDDSNVELSAKASYIGSKIFEARDVSKSFGDKKVLDRFSYTFARGEKVGIIGENGVGKSTFIKMLLGLVTPDEGSFDIGQTVRFGYYSQEGIKFDANKKVIDAVTEIAEEIKLSDKEASISPMTFLQKFLFSVPDQQKYIHTLSGGERARLHLATVLMMQPNFLILDEPTNDLDIITLGILEEYLASFKGCVIVISHDRFFLDSIADHLFVMTGEGKVKDFPGTYSEYREWQKAREEESRRSESADRPSGKAEYRRERQASRAPKLSFKEQQELKSIESRLPALENEKTELDAAFNSGDTLSDVDKMAARYKEISDEIDLLEMRWLELSEKSNQ